MYNLEWDYAGRDGITAKENDYTYIIYASRQSFVLEIWKGNSLKILHRYDTEDDAFIFAENHADEQHENKVDNIQAVIGISILTICCIILYSCS